MWMLTNRGESIKKDEKKKKKPSEYPILGELIKADNKKHS
jgi:hypothetical protein